MSLKEAVENVLISLAIGITGGVIVYLGMLDWRQDPSSDFVYNKRTTVAWNDLTPYAQSLIEGGKLDVEVITQDGRVFAIFYKIALTTGWHGIGGNPNYNPDALRPGYLVEKEKYGF